MFMPRQTFLSKEFFINSSEKHAKLSLLSLPQLVGDIKFVSENRLTKSLRFLFQNITEKKNYQVDVSLLPLDDNYTQVNLHVSYTNEQAFVHDNSIRYALINFQDAIYAALKGDINYYKPKVEVKKVVGLKVLMHNLSQSMAGLRTRRK
jgi:hypothetical protein